MAKRAFVPTIQTPVSLPNHSFQVTVTAVAFDTADATYTKLVTVSVPLDPTAPTGWASKIKQAIANQISNPTQDPDLPNDVTPDNVTLPFFESGVSAMLARTTQILAPGTVSFTPRADARALSVFGQAAGGAGGSVASAAAGTAAAGSGGASGGWFQVLIILPEPSLGSRVCTCSIGAGGTPVASSNGNAGGNVTFTFGGVTYTAFGGPGGLTMAGGSTITTVLGGDRPALSTNADRNASGDPGRYAIRVNGSQVMSGGGGTGYYGGAGNGSNVQSVGASALAPSGGGAGGVSINGGAAALGGSGGPATIEIQELT